MDITEPADVAATAERVGSATELAAAPLPPVVEAVAALPATGAHMTATALVGVLLLVSGIALRWTAAAKS